MNKQTNKQMIQQIYVLNLLSNIIAVYFPSLLQLFIYLGMYEQGLNELFKFFFFHATKLTHSWHGHENSRYHNLGDGTLRCFFGVPDSVTILVKDGDTVGKFGAPHHGYIDAVGCAHSGERYHPTDDSWC